MKRSSRLVGGLLTLVLIPLPTASPWTVAEVRTQPGQITLLSPQGCLEFRAGQQPTKPPSALQGRCPRSAPPLREWKTSQNRRHYELPLWKVVVLIQPQPREDREIQARLRELRPRRVLILSNRSPRALTSLSSSAILVTSQKNKGSPNAWGSLRFQLEQSQLK